MTELQKRVLVAVLGGPVVLMMCYVGGYAFLALILLMNGLALWEFYGMYREKGIFPYRWPGVLLSTGLILTGYFAPEWLTHALLGSMALIYLLHLRSRKGLASQNTLFTVGGILYITLFLSALLNLRMHFTGWMPEVADGSAHPGGRFLIVLLGSIWLCDTAAFHGGKKLGKHKLAPSISPNKTVEGAVFGLIFAVLAFAGLSRLFLPSLPLPQALISGVLVGTVGQLGDLVESRFKRDAGVKDTSQLLPGHGGILDRFDSLIFVSPFLWLQYASLGGIG